MGIPLFHCHHHHRIWSVTVVLFILGAVGGVDMHFLHLISFYIFAFCSASFYSAFPLPKAFCRRALQGVSVRDVFQTLCVVGDGGDKRTTITPLKSKITSREHSVAFDDLSRTIERIPALQWKCAEDPPPADTYPDSSLPMTVICETPSSSVRTADEWFCVLEP